ncbi:MAG: class I SAM-dependent methyltransferase [Aureispira sp.]|nr:class I SAM-dependent methyltransferase [Aureispira sp.]
MENKIKNKADSKVHWESVYDRTAVNKLGWYESVADQSMKLIDKANIDKAAQILNVGVGASTFIDLLLEKGYQNIIASDISAIALEQLKKRLGEKQKEVTWVVDDLTQPQKLSSLESVDVWHDRAVLHFFLKEEERQNYFQLLNQLVKIGGYAIIATFREGGAEKCSGLPIQQYTKELLEEKLGKDFELVESFEYTYINPGGSPRPYIYTLFKRLC